MPVPRLHHELAAKVKLIETLKEVKMQEPDTSFLAEEYVEILDNEEQIKRDEEGILNVVRAVTPYDHALIGIATRQVASRRAHSGSQVRSAGALL